MPKGPETILLGFVVPAVLVALCMLVSWRPWATVRYELSETDETVRDPKHRLPRGWWGAGLGLGLGAIVAHLALVQKTFLPIDASYEWRFVAAIGITPVAILIALVRFPWWAMLALRFVIGAAATTGVASLRFKNEQWEVGEGALRVVALALAITVFWTMLDSIASRLKGATPVIIFAGLCLASAPLLIFEAAYASAGDGAIALTLSLVPAIALAWWRKPISIARGGAAVVGLLLPLLWVDAVVWQSGINVWQGAAFLVAPIGAIVWLVPWVSRRRPWLRSVLTIGAVALLPTVVVLETLSRVKWVEYGIDLPQLRGGGGDAEAEDEYEYVW
jgi:hypothetical protein